MLEEKHRIAVTHNTTFVLTHVWNHHTTHLILQYSRLKTIDELWTINTISLDVTEDSLYAKGNKWI